MPLAIILGGTGVLGRAAARRLLASRWRVALAGRDPEHLPTDLAAKGARFYAADRHDADALTRVLGPGADLLVDALCFTAADVRLLLPLLRDVRSIVMLSSKAVYVDAKGRHSNSDVAPRFPLPIGEDQPTLSPADADYATREGYGAGKVAAERALLDSGLPVTVIRASKVHGEGASRPREWMFVKRVLDRRPALFLAHRGEGRDRPTTAVNTAALIERVAALPGRRILNSADPDVPNGLEIARTVAAQLGHRWEEILLDDGAEPGLGQHPWEARPPIVLDTSASLSLGYTPVGGYAQTVGEELEWLVRVARVGLAPAADDPFFAPLLDYALEDRFLAARAVPSVQ